MATLIFTAIGSAIGGPIGGLVGGLIGQRLDPLILGRGPKREGPRLRELSVQTSTYGTQIPKVYGAMRVAGTVIWSTDIVEKRTTSSGGKGRPSTTNYSYSVSFAVALSSRPALRVGRIWAEGNLLRGAQGDLKVDTLFRFHNGHEDQQPDPLIASVEGTAGCPAYRGLCYAVFENLQLADFGNRIPSLTFELFERDGTVSLAEICSDASRGLISGNPAAAIDGYALQGSTVRAALAPLAEAFLLGLRPGERKLELIAPDLPDTYWNTDTSVAEVNGKSVEPASERRPAGHRGLRTIALRYFDRDRDYQPGMQLSGASPSGQVDQQVDLPVVLAASKASQIAHALHLSSDAANDMQSISIPIGAEPPAIGQLWGDSAKRIASIEHFSGYMQLVLERAEVGVVANGVSVDPGRHVPSPDLAAGQTCLELVELPSIGTSPATEAVIAVAAGGTGPGWRRAVIYRNQADILDEVGVVAVQSAIGVLTSPVGIHSPNLLDTANEILVQLSTNAEPAGIDTGSAMPDGRSLLVLGDELIAYSRLESLGGKQYKISGLVRALHDAHSVAHAIGERVVFLDREALLIPDLGVLPAGTSLQIDALGLGDSVAQSRAMQVMRKALLPQVPVHGQIESLADGSVIIRWIWRSRHDAGWLDGVDVPLFEQSLMFEIVIWHGTVELLRSRTGAESLIVPASTFQSWALPAPATIMVEVRQVGDFGLSPPLQISATL